MIRFPGVSFFRSKLVLLGFLILAFSAGAGAGELTSMPTREGCRALLFAALDPATDTVSWSGPCTSGAIDGVGVLRVWTPNGSSKYLESVGAAAAGKTVGVWLRFTGSPEHLQSVEMWEFGIDGRLVAWILPGLVDRGRLKTARRNMESAAGRAAAASIDKEVVLKILGEWEKSEDFSAYAYLGRHDFNRAPPAKPQAQSESRPMDPIPDEPDVTFGPAPSQSATAAAPTPATRSETQPTPEQFARMQDCNMQRNVSPREAVAPEFNAPDCEKRVATPSARLDQADNQRCIERATSIQRQWAVENRAAAGNRAEMAAAERRAQAALRNLFQTSCAAHPDARIWIAKANETLSASPEGSSPGAANPGSAGGNYYAPIPNCLALRHDPKSTFQHCIHNACGQALEANFSGGMVSVWPQMCVPIAAGPNPVLFAACNKDDGFDRSRGLCRK
ncbi:MAG: hypothetical protein ABW032_05640 [Burkholderiaceae bacterium]